MTILARLALALTLCVAGASRAGAGGFPAFDANTETVVVGSDVPVAAADSQGVWDPAPGHVAPREGKKSLHQMWSPRIANMTDGFVRARITARSGVDAAFVMRGALPDAGRNEPPGAISGYVVVVEPRAIRLERWDLGTKRTLLPPQKVKAKHGVEIVAWLIGPLVRVDVYDVTTLANLASFAINDPRYPTGRIGFYVTGANAAEQALVLLSVRFAKIEGSAREVPAGPERFLALPALALARIAAFGPKARALFATMERTVDGGAVVKTSVEGQEILAREGVAARWLHSDPPFKYIDKSWLAARVLGVEATPAGFRIDRSYKDAEQVEALLRAYHQRFPELTRLVELGRTAGGRAILALVVTDNPDRAEDDEPTILLNGSHHGNELLPVENVLDATQILLERRAEPEIRKWIDGLEIWLVPLVNPDGNHAFWHLSAMSGRKNARDTDGNGRFDASDGVDLNRNYPFAWGALGELGSRAFPRAEYHRGPFPASEAETRAMMRLVDAIHPVASISYHTVSNVILVPYTTDGPTNPTPNEAWVVATEIAKSLPIQPTGRRMGVAKKIYAVDGTDQDHFRAAHGTLALLVEGAYHNPLTARVRKATITSTRGTWMELLRRVSDGPSVWGHVTNAAGQPVVAEIVIQEMAPQNGEIWTSRCRDGRFDRVVPHAGTWTLRVNAPGYVAATVALQVGNGPAAIDVRLDADGTPVRVFCGREDLASIDAWCACQTGACVEPGPPVWCRIAGRCVRAGALEPNGQGKCAPEQDQRDWSPAT